MIAQFEFAKKADMAHLRLAYHNPADIEWSAQELVAYLDSCDDPDALDGWLTSTYPRVSLGIATFFQIDLRNRAAYRRFVIGCRNRRRRPRPCSLLQGWSRFPSRSQDWSCLQEKVGGFSGGQHRSIAVASCDL
jgi:hypothetical protein